MLDTLKSALVMLLVTIDPIGLAPIFVGLTFGLKVAARRQVAVRAVLIAFVILAAFAFVGAAVLHALGISLPAFRIAGGLLLFWIAFEMVFDTRGERKLSLAEVAVTQDHIRNLAAFPLALPLIAGPGSITAVILLAGRTGGHWAIMAGLIGVIAVVLAGCLAVFLAAPRLAQILGITGNVVLSRLLGVILAALAVQFTIDGVEVILDR